MAKRNTGTSTTDAPFVLALGPGFTPNVDCHAVIETERGHNLGRVWWNRAAEPNSGVPGEIGGKSSERVLRAPCDGVVKKRLETAKRPVGIGDWIKHGDVIAYVGDGEVRAPFDGILRGLMRDGIVVKAGMKIGDIDARIERENCFTISDKSLAVGGGALEAILTWMNHN
jgi:xanthine dehydrogenase accessory factor